MVFRGETAGPNPKVLEKGRASLLDDGRWTMERGGKGGGAKNDLQVR